TTASPRWSPIRRSSSSSGGLHECDGLGQIAALRPAVARRINSFLVLGLPAPRFGWGRSAHKSTTEIVPHFLTLEAAAGAKAIL
ncbi:MAG: hypothetical protein ACYSVY_05955, partial [Planctomycetota bacterium]